MRHGRKIRKLGIKTDHRKAMLSNMAVSLLRTGRITTTHTRAKALVPVVSRLITFAKRGDLHARRLAAATVNDKAVLKKLFAEIAEELKDRKGGYTRVIKAGFRRGDGASMAVMELLISKKVVKEEKESKDDKEKKAEKKEDSSAETTKAAPKKEKKAKEPKEPKKPKEAKAGAKKKAATAK
jgi:large subunit ribosomal protein L17